MKLIGKLDESLVYEIDRGKYIIVIIDEDSGNQWIDVTSNWTNPLGRFAWSFTKCSSDPKEEACLKLIEERKGYIAEKLEQIDKMMEREDYAEWVRECAIENEASLAEMAEGETSYCD